MTSPLNDTPAARTARVLFPEGTPDCRLILAVTALWLTLSSVGVWTVVEANRRLVAPPVSAPEDGEPVAVPSPAPVPADEASLLDRLDRFRIPPTELVPGLPAETIALIGSHRWHHGGTVTALGTSPDGRRVVTGGRDNMTRLWDANTGVMVAALPGQPPKPDPDHPEHNPPPGEVTSVSFRADGRRLAIGGGGQSWFTSGARYDPLHRASGWVQVWDLTDSGPVLVAAFDCPARQTAAVAFAPAGDALAVLPGLNSIDDPFRSLLDPVEAEVLEPVGERWVSRGRWEVPGSCDTIAWSPDGRRIAVTGPEAPGVTLWDVQLESPAERAARHRLRWWLAGGSAAVVFALVVVAALGWPHSGRTTLLGIAFFGTLFPFLFALRAGELSGGWVPPLVFPILSGSGFVLGGVLLLASRLFGGTSRAVLGGAAFGTFSVLLSVGLLCQSPPWSLPFGAVAGLYLVVLLRGWTGSWRWVAVPVALLTAVAAGVTCASPFVSPWELADPPEKTQAAEWKLLAVAAIFAVIGAMLTGALLPTGSHWIRRGFAAIGVGVGVLGVAAGAVWLWNGDVRPAPMVYAGDLDVPGRTTIRDAVRIAFSPDGRWLAAARGPHVRVWEFNGNDVTPLDDPPPITDERDTPELRAVAEYPFYSTGGLAFDPTSRRLVAAVNFNTFRVTTTIISWAVDGELHDQRAVRSMGSHRLTGLTAIGFRGDTLLAADDGGGYTPGRISMWSASPNGGWDSPAVRLGCQIRSCVLVGGRYLVATVRHSPGVQEFAYRAWDLHAAEPAPVSIPVVAQSSAIDTVGELYLPVSDVLAERNFDNQPTRAWRVHDGRFVPLPPDAVRALPKPSADHDRRLSMQSADGRVIVRPDWGNGFVSDRARRVVVSEQSIEFPFSATELILTLDGRHLVTCNSNLTITVLRLREAITPNDAAAYRRRGEALARLGRYAEAKADFATFTRLISDRELK